MNERKVGNVPSKWKPKSNKRHFTYMIDFMLILFRKDKQNHYIIPKGTIMLTLLEKS